MKKRQETIGVIGAGIVGLTAAIELADAGYTVKIFELQDDVFKGTSSKCSQRLHFGHHYAADTSGDTARMCLKAAIDFKRRFPDFIDENSSWYNFVVKGAEGDVPPNDTATSIISADDYIAYCRLISKEYENLIRLDPANKVLGEPEDMFRVLEKTEYEDLVNCDRVACAVASAERRVDVEGLKTHLLAEIASRDIELFTRHEVIDASPTDESTYRLLVKPPGNKAMDITVDQVVNAAWTRAPELDSRVTSEKLPQTSTRLKAITRITLPPELADKPSMFFAQGLFGNYTNLGIGKDGKAHAVLVYEPQSLRGITARIVVPYDWRKLVVRGLESDNKRHIGNAMIEGMSRFIPALAQATIDDVQITTVMNRGTADLTNPLSDVHKRSDAGVTSYAGGGWHSVNVEKLSYAPMIARQVVEQALQCSESRHPADAEQPVEKQAAPVNVAIIGHGYWGGVLASKIDMAGNLNLKAIVSRSDANRETAQTNFPNAIVYSDIEAMLEDDTIEAVAITTPAETHYDLAKKALLAGKHVLLEKPFTQTSAQARELEHIADEKGLKLMADHTFLFTDAGRTLQETIIESGFNAKNLVSERTNNQPAKFDVIWDLAVHDLYLLDSLLDADPTSVSVSEVSHDSKDVVNSAVITVKLGRNKQAVIKVGSSDDFDKVRKITLTDERGKKILWDEISDTKLQKQTRQVSDPIMVESSGKDALTNMLEHFGNTIREDTVPIASTNQAIRTIELLEAIQASIAADGKEIKVALTPKARYTPIVGQGVC